MSTRPTQINRDSRCILALSIFLAVIAGGCQTRPASTPAPAPEPVAPAAATPPPTPPAAPAAAPTAAVPTSPSAAASATKPPTPILPSWWNRPAPQIDGKVTLIQRGDGDDPATSKTAAIAAARESLRAAGTDADKMEILRTETTKMGFEGRYRTFVLVAAAKPPQ